MDTNGHPKSVKCTYFKVENLISVADPRPIFQSMIIKKNLVPEYLCPFGESFSEDTEWKPRKAMLLPLGKLNNVITR